MADRRIPRGDDLPLPPERLAELARGAAATPDEARLAAKGCLRFWERDGNNTGHHLVHHRRRDRAVEILRARMDDPDIREALELLLGKRDGEGWNLLPYPMPGEPPDLRARHVFGP